MKFSVARTLASFSVAASLAVFPCGAQTTPSAPPAPATQPNQQSGKPNQTGGKVIFERSINSNGDANGQPAPGPTASEPAIKLADALSVTRSCIVDSTDQVTASKAAVAKSTSKAMAN